jgi:hypothetical protein
MRQHKDYLFVDGLPEGVKDLRVDNTAFNLYWGSKPRTIKPLPAGQYEYLCLASEAGEEVARGIVMNEHGDLFDYTGKNMYCATGTESLSSLLHSLNLKGEVAILKRVK